MEIWERSEGGPWFGGVSAQSTRRVPSWERRNRRSTEGNLGEGNWSRAGSLGEGNSGEGIWDKRKLEHRGEFGRGKVAQEKFGAQREIWEGQSGPREIWSTEENLGEGKRPKRNLDPIPSNSCMRKAPSTLGRGGKADAAATYLQLLRKNRPERKSNTNKGEV